MGKGRSKSLKRNIGKLCGIFGILTLSVLISACGKNTANTWQEQYDLGMRYLEEQNYEEAVVAFTAAIELDPKQADAYVGLANAYVGTENYEEASGAIQEGIAACGETETFTRLADNISFLQSGETGIKITSFSFDNAKYLAGEATEFLVSVIYRCPDDQEYILMIGANTQEAESFHMLDEDFAVTGYGYYQFCVSIVPVQWDESYFGIYVNLSEADHGDTWTPFSSDVLYIDPEGNLIGDLAENIQGGA